MIVRCGSCRAELEVSGPGEFVCPACGTRNAVRGAPAPAAGGFAPGYDPSGLTIPGGMPPRPSAPPAQDAAAAGISWATCPACSWKFAHGKTEQITCPNCRATLTETDGVLTVQA